ncbi:nuclease-related domain-containing protein [Georgenia yuyongxinii]|nr:nuclease-related domain-containing protein [Georgenia yuyongxinii]
MNVSASENRGARRRDLRDLAVHRSADTGTDRLRVMTGGGTEIGWYDLTTRETHPLNTDLLPTVLSEVGKWLDRFEQRSAPPGEDRTELTAPPRSAAAPAVATAPNGSKLSIAQLRARALARDRPCLGTSEPGSATPGELASPIAPAPRPADVDLAGRRPGAMARAQAEARRREAPVRTFIARLFDLRTEERAWRVGAVGEELVAAQLAKLCARDRRWTYLNAVPIGTNGADIDHVLIGPGGVFTLNAKHHPGAKIWVRGQTFMVNGKKVPYVRNSLFEAERTSRLLSRATKLAVPVTPVIVLVRHERLTRRNPTGDVVLLERRQIPKWFSRVPDTLPDETREAVLGAARRSTTWTGR